jgi:plasmid stabilization system protein ParE
MSLALQRARFFIRDFELQTDWYVQAAGAAVAGRYLQALDETLQLLCLQPGMGRLRRFRHPRLKGIRSFRVRPPFDRHLIFYRSITRFCTQNESSTGVAICLGA